VRLRTLLMIRWIGIAGQAAALVLVRIGLGYPLPFPLAVAVVGISAAVNLWLSARQPGATLLSDRWAAVQLGYDMLQLAVLLYLTGGLANPFAILILAPVTVSATVLSRRSTISLSLLALGIVAVLAWRHMPLPWPGEGLRLEPVFVFAFAVALGLSVIFIAAYVLSVVEEARRLSDALSATQMALDRERQLSAVGALAAAAAHELGTPLGTIALVAHEIARDLPKESPLAADVELLLSQSKRCREILSELAARPDAERRTLGPLPMAALIEAAAAPYRRKDVAFRVETSGDLPAVAERPELSHGLGTLLQNAFEFARKEVVVHLSAEGQEVTAAIADDGPGFDPALLEKLGEPYVSRGAPGRGRPGEHMGLGVFIALTLLERTGAVLRFGNRPEGGSEAMIVWRRTRLEEGT
jgi:two-component system sensor histidine kinase RegB